MKINKFDVPIFVETQAEARAHLDHNPRSVAVVYRGRLRGAVFHCPCGCGENIVLNLDHRAGPAWRIRVDVDALTIIPSVWREGGCESHFILWKGEVLWCRFEDDVDDRANLDFRFWEELLRMSHPSRQKKF